MNNYAPKYMQLLVSKLGNIVIKKQTVVSVSRELNISRQTVHKYLARYRRFGEDGINKCQTKKDINQLIIKLQKR